MMVSGILRGVARLEGCEVFERVKGDSTRSSMDVWLFLRRSRGIFAREMPSVSFLRVSEEPALKALNELTVTEELKLAVLVL